MSEPVAITSIPEFKGTQEETLIRTLGIEVLECTRAQVVLRMPVEPRVHQPYGLLHGGASVALAETAASMGAMMQIDRATQMAVGIEINANHLRGKRDGHVIATATPIHTGRSTQVWSVSIVDEQGKAICVSRCTLAVVPRPA